MEFLRIKEYQIIMNIELATDLLASELLKLTDPNKTGVVVEIGLGSGNYSFVWARSEGYRCHAIEPLPVPDLINACLRHGVHLTEAAISKARGTASIYLGELEGHSTPDVSSLNPRWWGCGHRSREVVTLSLKDFIVENRINQISLLKIDTEGSEFEIISNIASLNPEQKPLMVCFEYGGGGTNGSGAGGWAPEFLRKTIETIKSLIDAGYCEGVMLEESIRVPRCLMLKNGYSPERLFAGGERGGNLLFLRKRLGEKTLQYLVRSKQSSLDSDARRARLQRIKMEFDHYKIRATQGLKHRFSKIRSILK